MACSPRGRCAPSQTINAHPREGEAGIIPPDRSRMDRRRRGGTRCASGTMVLASRRATAPKRHNLALPPLDNLGSHYGTPRHDVESRDHAREIGPGNFPGIPSLLQVACGNQLCARTRLVPGISLKETIPHRLAFRVDVRRALGDRMGEHPIRRGNPIPRGQRPVNTPHVHVPQLTGWGFAPLDDPQLL